MEPKLTPEELKRTLAVDFAGKYSMRLANLLHCSKTYLLTQAEVEDLQRLQRLLRTFAQPAQTFQTTVC